MGIAAERARGRLKDIPRLYLRCKTCDTEFASGISVDKKSFETLILSGNQHTCPKGHAHTYDKKDYYLHARAVLVRRAQSLTDDTKKFVADKLEKIIAEEMEEPEESEKHEE